MIQYILWFWTFGAIGFILASWHILVVMALAIYIDFKRGKAAFKNWSEFKQVTSETIEDYLELIQRKQKKPDS